MLNPSKLRGWAAGMFLISLLLASATAQESVSTAGSGEKYRTTVQRVTKGQIAEEDFRQASLLGSQVVLHLNQAAKDAADGDEKKARAELKKVETLVKVLRELLPVTEVTTVVKDPQGNEVYRDVSKVQDDQIPIFRRMIAVEVVEPIVEAKKEEATLKGLRLADADLIHTTLLVDLDLLERKLRRAFQLLEKGMSNDVTAQIVTAQTQALRFVANKNDHPLVEAQIALRLAERMAEDGKLDAARQNLLLAHTHLDLYRGLVGEKAGEPVRALAQDAERLAQQIAQKQTKVSVASAIRELWQRVVGMFSTESGELRPDAHPASRPSAEASAAAPAQPTRK